VDLPWRVPRCRDQLAALAAHFYPKNELLGSVRMAEARQVRVIRYESVANFVVRLQTAINRVDEVRPHRLIVYEMRELLDAGLAESKEPSLVNLATHLQMAPHATTWTDLKDMVSRFDTTAAGRLRLILSTVSEIDDNTNRTTTVPAANASGVMGSTHRTNAGRSTPTKSLSFRRRKRMTEIRGGGNRSLLLAQLRTSSP
jgi:hypothetical protein